MAADDRPLGRALPTWRTFRFFEAESVREDTYEDAMNDVVCVAYVPATSAAWASPRGALVTGTCAGDIRVVDARTFVEVGAWRAFERACTHLYVDPASTAVVGVGYDDAHNTPLVRVWRWTESAELQTSFRAQAVISANHEMEAASVTCIAVSPLLAHVALGLSDGRVYMLRGAADSLSSKEVSTIRAKCVREPTAAEDGAGSDAVTSLVVCAPTHLLVSTVSCTLKYTLQGPGAGHAPVVIDTIGCPPGCGAMIQTCSEEGEGHNVSAPSAPKLVLAREEALYVIGPSGREASFALEGTKRWIQTLHGQIVVIMHDRVIVFDLDTKCITYTGPGADAALVWTNERENVPDECIYIHGAQPTRLVAKSLAAKLEHLFHVHLYVQAIPFIHAYAARFPHARLPTVPPSAALVPMRTRTPSVSPVRMLVADVHRRFGEYLYARGDFANAMQQFCQTIGVVSPSIVIRQFLDAQRLQYLAVYLEALLHAGLANTDHAMLLLNCYTKLRDMSALDKFVRSKDVPFDVPAAIDVCRRAACTSQAAYLAQAHKLHDTYLSIELRDANDADAALTYLSRLPAVEVVHSFATFARLLLDAEPRKTVDVLVHAYVDGDGFDAVPFSAILSHFVGHAETLELFLERLCEGHATLPTDLLVLIHDTLLELYLDHAHEKALAILQREPMAYTPSRALMLCTRAQYTVGLLCVYEQLGMVDAILQHWIDAYEQDPTASARVLDTLERFGNEHTELYVPVLAFFTSTKDLLDAHRAKVESILAYIDEHALLSPLEMVQLLGQNDVAPIGLLTPYLMAHVEHERAEVVSAEKLVASYRTEAQEKEAELAALQSSDEPRVFQEQACAMCKQPLELPSVHFMCGHSFRLPCLPDGERTRECPICAAQHKTVDTLRDTSMLRAPDMVLDAVHTADADDGTGFDVLADLFAKGIHV